MTRFVGVSGRAFSINQRFPILAVAPPVPSHLLELKLRAAVGLECAVPLRIEWADLLVAAKLVRKGRCEERFVGHTALEPEAELVVVDPVDRVMRNDLCGGESIVK